MIEQFMFGTYFIFCLLYSKTTFQWKTKNPNKNVELAAGEFKINIIVSVSIKLGICKIATKTSWMGGKKKKNNASHFPRNEQNHKLSWVRDQMATPRGP
jgi:hypothetical protein